MDPNKWVDGIDIRRTYQQEWIQWCAEQQTRAMLLGGNYGRVSYTIEVTDGFTGKGVYFDPDTIEPLDLKQYQQRMRDTIGIQKFKEHLANEKDKSNEHER